MAVEEQQLTTRAENGSPYQLDSKQISKASTALLKHIQSSQVEKAAVAPTKSLLADADQSDEEDAADEVAVWLLVTTKKHIVDKQRLKPGKVVLPHSLHTSKNSRICLITADPQRKYKNVVAHPSFPSELSSRIGRVIGITKLKTKYKSYESRRQLASEYDLFLADDRIVTLLPQLLGKIFYKGSSKRPVPISLVGGERKSKDAEGKKIAKANKDNTDASVADVQAVSREIERALNSALIHLSPSTFTSIKVGLASWKPETLRENIEALAPAVIERFVPQKWRNVRALHIKGPETMSLPIWLAEELWVDERDVTEKKIEPPSKSERKQRRKLLEAAKAETEPEKKKIEEWDEVNEDGVIENKKRKRVDLDAFAKEVEERKAKIKQQRQKIMEEAGGVSL